jgi:hypothetical protein
MPIIALCLLARLVFAQLAPGEDEKRQSSLRKKQIAVLSDDDKPEDSELLKNRKGPEGIKKIPKIQIQEEAPIAIDPDGPKRPHRNAAGAIENEDGKEKAGADAGRLLERDAHAGKKGKDGAEEGDPDEDQPRVGNAKYRDPETKEKDGARENGQDAEVKEKDGAEDNDQDAGPLKKRIARDIDAEAKEKDGAEDNDQDARPLKKRIPRDMDAEAKEKDGAEDNDQDADPLKKGIAKEGDAEAREKDGADDNDQDAEPLKKRIAKEADAGARKPKPDTEKDVDAEKKDQNVAQEGDADADGEQWKAQAAVKRNNAGAEDAEDAGVKQGNGDDFGKKDDLVGELPKGRNEDEGLVQEEHRMPITLMLVLVAIALAVFVTGKFWRDKQTLRKRLEIAASEEPLLENEELF